MQYFVYGTLLAYFWIGSLLQGFYQQLAFLIGNLVLLGAAWIVFARKQIRITNFHLILILFVFSYWISIAYSVDREQAVLEALKVTGLVPISFLITTLVKERYTGLLKSWMWIGTALTGWGVLFGMYRNNRLESTFDYANTLAVFLLVGVLLAVFFYVQQARYTYLLALVVNGTGLLLTLSRSVWVLWLLAIAASLLLFPKLRQKQPLIHLGTSHFASLLLAMLLKLDPLFFWQRVQSLNPQASEFKIRLVYWQDSIKMLGDYWLTGAGGGGWNVLFYQYRSQDYFVKYVHNQYLQVALDTGIIGLLAFLVLVGLFYYQVLRVWRAAQETELAKIGFLLVTILLLHAGFDVDLTFPMLFGMLICLMGMFFGETEARSVRVRINNKKQRGGRLFSKLAVHALFVCCVFGSLWSTIGNSYKLHGVGLVQHAKWEEALADFSKAESMIPWSDTAHYEAAKLYVILGNQTKDFRFYQHARTELEAAQRLVPKQSLYPSLLQQLPK